MSVADVVEAKENCSTAQGAGDIANSEFIEVPEPNQENSITPIHGGGEGMHQTLQYSSLADFGTFSQHLMCKDRYLNYTPIEPTTIFSPGDTKAACLTIVSLRIDDTVDFRWYYRNDASKTWVSCYNWSYFALYYNGEHAIEGYLNIRGYWPGTYYPRAYKVEVYYMNSSFLFREFFEVTNGGLNSPRMCEEIDANEYPVNIKSRFTIGVDNETHHYLRFDKVAYFNEELGYCHNFTTVWTQPDGTTYKIHSSSFNDYKDANITLNYWMYEIDPYDYIFINSSTLVGNWKVEVYLDNYYFNNTWIPYGPIATTPFIIGSEPVADWTFMVYLDADNTLENASLDIFGEIASVGSTSKVNIVVQMDRSPDPDIGPGNWTECYRFNVTKDMTPMPENATLDLGEVNMGNPDTLKDFVNWTINNYPANYYCLVLWDHGAGWMGLCFDVTNGTDYLSLPELSQALTELPAIMDVVFIDACSMSMTEVAYQIKDYANVLIGPEGLGYAEVGDSPAPYDNYLSNLTSNSSILPTDFAMEVATDYINWCWSIPVEAIPNATISATDLTKISSLMAAIDDFAVNLKEKETPYHEQISLARNRTQGYEGPFAYQTGYLIDLYSFVQLTYQNAPDGELQNTAYQLMLSIENAIILEVDKADPDSHGLSIFFPDEKGKYDFYENFYNKTAFAIDTPWDELLKYHLSGYVLMIQTPYSSIQVGVNETSYTTDAYGKIQVFVLPGSYTVNATATVLIGPDSRAVFTRWNDGSTLNPRTISVNGELTLEAEYETQHRLVIDTNFGTTDPPVGEYWCNASLHMTISATAPSSTEGERYFWLGWTGTGSGSANSTNNPVSITVDAPINMTAGWRHEYSLTVTSLYGSPTPLSEWLEAGTFINTSITSPASGSTGTRYICTGWTGTGSVSASGTSTSAAFTIDRPSSIEWNWKTQYLLTVKTNPTGLNPQPSFSPQGPWYDSGTLVNLTALKISEYVFNYWTADGASWDLGVNPVTLTMDGPCEAIAQYEHASTWWQTLSRPESLQIILGLAGTLITVVLVGVTWIRARRRRGIIKAFLTEIDEVYSRLKMNPRKCEEELYRLRNTILEGVTEGKITEESYDILDKRIDKHMEELRKQKWRKHAEK